MGLKTTKTKKNKNKKAANAEYACTDENGQNTVFEICWTIIIKEALISIMPAGTEQEGRPAYRYTED
jgi:hypothetical protein